MKKVDVEGKDTCTLVRFGQDGYGDLVLDDMHVVKCLFLYGMSQQEYNFAEQLQCDAHSYLDVDDQWVLRNIAPLQGSQRITDLYLIFNRYGVDEWYKIERVKIGRTVLLDNVDNNIHVFLSKTTKMYDFNESI